MTAALELTDTTDIYGKALLGFAELSKQYRSYHCRSRSPPIFAQAVEEDIIGDEMASNLSSQNSVEASLNPRSIH